MKIRQYGALSLAMLIGACGLQQNPATGDRMLSLMSEQQEFAMGRDVAKKSVTEFGGQYKGKPELTSYIRDRVARIAAVGERSDKPFEAELLDDPIMNAFAVPGYVMVSRGILPFFQNEAEMVFVLGHEVGHVTGKHHVRSHSRQLLTTGAMLIASYALAEQTDSSDLARGAMTAASFAIPFGMAHFSRAQELEADTLGVRYMSKLGYPAFESSDVFRMFDAYGKLNESIMASAGETGSKSMFHRALASHPDDMTRINQAASSAGVNPRASNHQERYLKMIDGLAFGPKLEEGVVSQHRYLSPAYGVRFDIPRQFLVNGMDGMPLAVDPYKKAVLDVKVFEKITTNTDIKTAMMEVLKGASGLKVIKNAPLQVAVAEGVASGKKVHYVAALGKHNKTGKAALVVAMVRNGQASADKSIMAAANMMANSMAKLTPGQSKLIKSQHIGIRTVRRGESVKTLSKELPFDVYQEEWFRLLNGLHKGENVRAGQKVKMVVDPNAKLRVL
ncbi:MAG: M48 family metalloprotease [Alphaproteobacteria bacterium]|nr:M48 family metalloprotease [Alphaproteobacteria bacterium]